MITYSLFRMSFSVPVSTFSTNVKGAKELNTYIQDTTSLIQAIRVELEHDLMEGKATVTFNPICRKNHNLRAELCRQAHIQFVQDVAFGKQSNLVIAESTVNECLVQLEQLRKMFVNNKQQKKNEKSRIKAIIREVSALLPAPTFDDFGLGMFDDETKPRDENVCLTQLRQLIEIAKQHHKSVSRKLLEQAHIILLAMRTRHIIAYKEAAQNAAGAVIHHAEQSRAYIRQCRERALIEYCASAWWHMNYKDAMDSNEYEVSVESMTPEHDHDIKHFSGLTAAAEWNNLEIIVKMNGDIIIWRHPVNEDVAKVIITEEAVKSFEWEETQMWYLHQYYQQQSQAPEQEQAPEQQEQQRESEEDPQEAQDRQNAIDWLLESDE